MEKLLVLNHYPYYPITHGGSLFTDGMLRALSKRFDITFIGIASNGFFREHMYVNEHLHIVTLPFNFTQVDTTELRELGWTAFCLEQQKDLAKVLSGYFLDADIITVSHCYSFGLLKASQIELNGKTVWYLAHNCEYNFVKANWPNNVKAQIKIREIENELIEKCDTVLTLTEYDGNFLKKEYSISEDKFLCIGAGFDYGNIDIEFLLEKRYANKHNPLTCVLISSLNDFFLKDTLAFLEIARTINSINFQILGSVGNGIDATRYPNNIYISGTISDEEKERCFCEADFAVNVSTQGSGLNIKNLEYFAYGLPVISTPFGMRGINAINGINCVISELTDFRETLLRFASMDFDSRKAISLNAHRLLRTEHNWNILSEKVFSLYQKKHKTNNDELLRIRDFRNSEYVIVGYGKRGKRLKKLLDKSGFNLVGIMDNNKKLQGKTIDGYVIKSAEEFKKNRESANFIISLANFSLAKEVSQQLLYLGINDKNIFFFFGSYILNVTSAHCYDFAIDCFAEPLPNFFDLESI